MHYRISTPRVLLIIIIIVKKKKNLALIREKERKSRSKIYRSIRLLSDSGEVSHTEQRRDGYCRHRRRDDNDVSGRNEIG